MFSKSITNSSRFLMMPPTSQLLYGHLSMNADDDGFVEHFSIMRMVEAKPDDLSVLNARGFVQIFDDKVLVITEWRENNYIQNDRYTPSKYLKVYSNELKALSSGQCIQDVSKMDTQVRLGKVRLGKVIEDVPKNKTRFSKPTLEEITAYCLERENKVSPQKFHNYYESKGWLIGKSPMKNWKAAVRTWEANGFDDKKSKVEKGKYDKFNE